VACLRRVAGYQALGGGGTWRQVARCGGRGCCLPIALLLSPEPSLMQLACSTLKPHSLPPTGATFFLPYPTISLQCGNACGSTAKCVEGKCAPICVAPETTCPGVSGCVNTNTDVNNCGECGNSCAAGLVCRAGQCACSSTGE